MRQGWCPFRCSWAGDAGDPLTRATSLRAVDDHEGGEGDMSLTASGLVRAFACHGLPGRDLGSRPMGTHGV